MIAGAMISIGASASSAAAHSVMNVGLSKLIAGCVFPVGLMMVILMRAELFTGDCMLVLGVKENTISAGRCISMLLTVYLGNLIGSVIIASLISLSGQFDYSSGALGAYTIKVAAGKTGISFVRGIASGIMCNILVCAAVLMAVSAKDITGKLFCCFFVILAFVISGFEHCVANMYYITAGLICKSNPVYLQIAKEMYSLSDSALDNLDLWHFVSANLLPVTIGNIIGGMFFVAIPMYETETRKEIVINAHFNTADNRR